MAYGFGILDYIVVGGVLLISLHSLATSPQRLLPLLPTFLTIDFFIPFGSQLTPYRLVPLLLGGWLMLRQRLYADRRNAAWLITCFSAILVALIYAVAIGDAGSRPWLRAMQYLGLIFVFIFVFQMIRKWKDVESALWGLGLAGAIHGIYALYQLVAFRFGLPFRGIVYNEMGEGVAGKVGVAGLLRVNGFADEPKRLGYILFCGALALLYFHWQNKIRQQNKPHRLMPQSVTKRRGPIVLFGICVIMSLMTFASSYFAALVITFALLAALLSGYAVKLVAPISLIIVVVALSAPDQFSDYIDGLMQLFDARRDEMEQGLNSRFVYRQEFFAQDYVAHDWTVLLSGIGLGRYNTEFMDRYGAGAGFAIDGSIMPLNSQFYEVGLDLGISGLLAVYLGASLLAMRLGRKGGIEFVLSTMLLFMMIQSLFINNLYMLAYVAATCASFLAVRHEARRHPRAGWASPKGSSGHQQTSATLYSSHTAWPT